MAATGKTLPAILQHVRADPIGFGNSGLSNHRDDVVCITSPREPDS